MASEDPMTKLIIWSLPKCSIHAPKSWSCDLEWSLVSSKSLRCLRRDQLKHMEQSAMLCGTLEKWEKPDVYLCTLEVFNIYHTPATLLGVGSQIHMGLWSLFRSHTMATTTGIFQGSNRHRSSEDAWANRLKTEEEIVLRERKNSPIFANP